MHGWSLGIGHAWMESGLVAAPVEMMNLRVFAVAAGEALEWRVVRLHPVGW